MPDPANSSVGEFLQATPEASVTEAVYRVVGKTDDALVLLRVSDEAGRRQHTGALERVDHETVRESFESSSGPRPTVIGVLRNMVQGPYWQVRRFF